MNKRYTPFKNFSFLIVLVMGILSSIGLSAQPDNASLRALDLRNNLVIPAGPEAASLGRYGEVGISHYTGALDFSIPLASIGDKAMNWSFSLRYNASGIKPDELPAQVGQNWSLEGVGIITRSVQGFPDRDQNYYNAAQHWQTTTTEFTDLIHENYFLDSVARGSIETQPDLYHFNFGPYSGKFYIKPNKTIFFEDAADLEIVPTYVTNAGVNNGDISSFQIRDAAGFIYTFEFPEKTTVIYEHVSAFTGTQYLTYVYNSAWYLKEVKHPNDGMGKLTFDYDVVATNFTPVVNTWWLMSHTYTTGPPPDGWNCFQELCGSTVPTTNSSWSLSAFPIINNRRYIKEVNFFKGTTKIEKLVFTNNNNPCTYAYDGKQLSFLTRYAGPGATVENTGWAFAYTCRDGRLFLSSVNERNNALATKPPYIFTYYTGTIPAPASVKRDYWGYANYNTQIGFIPTYKTGCPGTTYAGLGDRTPNETAMKAGILIQITYPTGGYTIINYEGHQVPAYHDCQTLVGGLRVKDINNYAKSGVLAFKRQYKYTTSLTSSTTSGKLLNGFQLAKTMLYQNYPIAAENCLPQGYSFICTSVTIHTSPIVTSGRVGGPHVGYSRIEEINNGKTVYFFKNTAGNIPDNGDLTSKEIYDASDNVLEKTDYTYVSGTTGTMYSMVAEAHDVQDNKTLLCKSGANSYEWRLQCCAPGAGTTGCLQVVTFQNKLKRSYAPIYSRKKLVTNEVTTYNSKPYTATQTSLIKKLEYQYNYASAMLPTQVRLLDASNNELSKQVMVYPTGSNVPAAMLTKRMYSEPVEVINYVNGAQVYGTKKLYPTTGSIHITTTIQEKFASGSYADLYLVTNFDAANGNIKSANRRYDQESSYIYSSDGGRITAAVTNATVSEIAFTSFDNADTYQGGWTNLTASYIKNTAIGGATGNGYYNPSAATYLISPVLTSGKYIVSYYSKTGTVTITNNSGTTTVHRNIYGADNAHAGGWKYSEHIVSLTNSIRVNVPAGGFIDELRIYPADALMKSFSYDKNTYLPQCISDADGKTKRFEYDLLNRLTVGRDLNDHFLLTNDYYYANTNTYNAILTRRIQKSGITSTSAAAALTGKDVLRQFGYFDGLGRPDQNVTLDGSPTSNDIAGFPGYDTYGRPYREYLPYTINGAGTAVNTSYRTSAGTEQASFYTPYGGNGFTEQILEVSPLSRLQGIKHPGDWNTHPTSIKYMFNGATDVRNPKVSNAYYAANTLFKIESKDEDQKTVYTYTDLLGRKVMEDRGGAKTYYLYDNAGNITEVIQPEGAKLLHNTPANIVSTPSVNKFCFLYTYNIRYLMYSNQVPGALTYSLHYYDRLDRPVMTIDPKGFKAFTKYDILSRPILTGKYTGSSLPSAGNGLFENKSTTGHFYTTNLSFPTSSTEVYSVQYYDDYDFDANYTDNYTYSLPSPDPGFYPPAAYMFARGMATGTKTGVLNTAGTAPSVFLETYPFYDKKGREIFRRSSNPYSGSDWEWTNYNFMGWAAYSRLQHTAVINSVSKSYSFNYKYEYDHAGRLFKTWHKVGDPFPNDGELLSENTYGERDDLSRKRLASSQDVDYKYNIRMWLTDINDAFSSGCSATDLFAMRINYNSNNANFSVGPYYNGNISSIEWRTGANCQVGGVSRNEAAYGFTYDTQSRLIKAAYGEYNSSNSWQSGSANRYTVDPINYDDNGNITGITRKGWISGATYNTIDQLTYSYSGTYGNQLATIAEASDITRGFKKISAGASGYSYDNNGNVIVDGYRGITGITYNYLNLPAKITYSATQYIELTYDAAGRKWKKTTVNGGSTTEKYYFGPVEYNGSNLEALYHQEGRAVPSGGSYEYQYAIRDHLGSTRVMFKMVSGTATLIQENHYYPFGMELDGSVFVGGTNQYLFNGIERNEDLGLNWDLAAFRSYDASIGRWMQVDPRAEKYYEMTPYNGMGNNPISIIDPAGDTLRAVSETSAQRALGIIRSGLPSPLTANNLFSIGSDGVTFSPISGKALNNALGGLTADQAALVIGYAAMINGSETNVVEVVNREETISEYGQKTLGGGIKTGADLDAASGGGYSGQAHYDGNIVRFGGDGTYGILTANSQVRLDYNDGSRLGMPGETLAHELLGHGLGSRGGRSDGQQLDAAIQTGNIYLRTQGKTYYRPDHGVANHTKAFNPNAIPNYLSRF